MSTKALAYTLVLAMAATAPQAFAAPKGYEKQYKTGVQLENAGSVADALATFEAIPAASQDFDTRLHIASCKRKLGRLLAAEQDYEAIRTDPSADEPTRDTAASDLEALRARIPKIKVALAATTSGVIVQIDGAQTDVPTTKVVDPGSHLVVARRDGMVVFERRIELTEGTTIAVVIDAPPASAVAPIGSPPTEETSPVIARGTPTLAWVASGVAVGSFVVGSFFLLRASSLRDESDELALQGNPEGLERASDARGAQTFGRIGLGIGVAATGAAAYLSFTGRGEPPRAAKGVRIAPAVASAWGFSIEGAW